MKKLLTTLILFTLLTSCEPDIYFDVCDYVTFEVRTTQENLPITVNFNINGIGENSIIINDTLFSIRQWGCIGENCYLSAQKFKENVYSDTINDTINVKIYFYYPVRDTLILISENSDVELVEINETLNFNFNFID